MSPSSLRVDHALDRQTHEALYVQLADALTRELAAGTYAPGDRLPTESELMRRYRISRVTVRQALRVLQDRGLILRRPAKGTFAAGPPVKQDLSMFGGFHDALAAQGFQPTMRLLEYRLVLCPAAVRRKLHHEKAMLLVRQHCIRNAPLAVARTHLHPAAERVTREQVELNPSYRILEELLGFRIARADLAIRADRADGESARMLGVRIHSPVLILERTTYGTTGMPLEHTIFSLRSDAYEFAFTTRGPMPLSRSIRASVTTIEKVSAP